MTGGGSTVDPVLGWGLKGVNVNNGLIVVCRVRNILIQKMI